MTPFTLEQGVTLAAQGNEKGFQFLDTLEKLNLQQYVRALIGIYNPAWHDLKTGAPPLRSSIISLLRAVWRRHEPYRSDREQIQRPLQDFTFNIMRGILGTEETLCYTFPSSDYCHILDLICRLSRRTFPTEWPELLSFLCLMIRDHLVRELQGGTSSMPQPLLIPQMVFLCSCLSSEVSLRLPQQRLAREAAYNEVDLFPNMVYRALISQDPSIKVVTYHILTKIRIYGRGTVRLFGDPLQSAVLGIPIPEGLQSHSTWPTNVSTAQQAFRHLEFDTLPRWAEDCEFCDFPIDTASGEPGQRLVMRIMCLQNLIAQFSTGHQHQVGVEVVDARRDGLLRGLEKYTVQLSHSHLAATPDGLSDGALLIALEAILLETRLRYHGDEILSRENARLIVDRWQAVLEMMQRVITLLGEKYEVFDVQILMKPTNLSPAALLDDWEEDENCLYLKDYADKAFSTLARVCHAGDLFAAADMGSLRQPL